MAPNLAIKSESWLDLSSTAARSEELTTKRRNNATGESLQNQFEGQRRLQRGHSVEPASLAGSISSSNKGEHLLIRLRQQSYFLNRSNSATLSSASQLSNSIDLEPALVARASSNSVVSGEQEIDEQQVEQANLRRELPLGLKSFKQRLEARRRTSRGVANLLNSRGGRLQDPNSSTSQSPFARSWSSLSERLSSRLNHLGHSWKSFLYKYNQRVHQEEHDEDKPQPEVRPSQDFVNHNQQQQQNAFPLLADVRQRLTCDWVTAHHQHHHVGQKLEQESSGPNVIEPCCQVGERYLLTSSKSAQLSKFDVTRGWRDGCAIQTEREEVEARVDQRQQRGASEAPPNNRSRSNSTKQQSPNWPIIRQENSPKSHSASSSTTLVNHQIQQSEEARTRAVEQKHASNRLSLPVHFGDDSPWHLLRPSSSSSADSSSSSFAADTMNSRQQMARAKSQNGSASKKLTNLARQQNAQTPVATSDYWSSAVTTSANSEFAPVNQQQPQQQFNSMLAQNELLRPEQQDQKLLQGRNSQMMMTPDQEYYFDVADAATMQNLMQQDPLSQQQQPQAIHLFNSQIHHHHQLDTPDPDDYDDYAVPADESCCRLDRSQVELVQLIGEGQKGYVFLGKLQSKDGQTIQDVAIKTLKFETEQLIDRLMNEAAMMKQLEHPHIIKFMGMCPETPALIAMELAQFGEIKHYLKLNRHLIKCSQLVLFAFQISTALSYLESKNYVHRDVAARNVLVCSHNCVKLADFGLSRNLQPSVLFGRHHQQQQQLLNHHRHHQDQELLLRTSSSPTQVVAADSAGQSLYVAAPCVKLPVRWLAPESLVFRRFTSASDVWMFAVCVWELFQFGQVRPWAQLRNNQVLMAIEAGQRLNKPESCPDRLYQLMLKCWGYAPVQRPKFREIKQCIWSIYLNERTREQLELERYERERQRLVVMNRQQQQVPLLSNNNLKQQQLLLAQDSKKSNVIQRQPARAPVHATSPTALNHTPSSNYSSTLGTNTTTTSTDNEQSTSPCSSAFNSVGRQRVQIATAKVAASARDSPNSRRNQALQTQLSRFEQRQTATPTHNHSTNVNKNNNSRSNGLQKQRSQGAIGMSTNYLEAKEDASRQRQESGRSNLAKATGRSNQMQPHDDEALEYVKRSRRRQQGLEAHQLQAFSVAPDDEWESDDEVEEIKLRASAFQSNNVNFHRQRIMSASPALTSGSQSRMVSMEPAYEGVFEEQQHKGQVAMLRTNFDLIPVSRRTSPINLTTSPALTCSNSPRPTSWRLSPTATTDANNNSRLAAQSNLHDGRQTRPQDQLGHMLQALRITPIKARLKNSPEHNVRVLRREEQGPPMEPVANAKAPPIEPKSSSDNQMSQLMLHQRLLGRIRPSSSSLNQHSEQPTNNQQRPKSQVLHDTGGKVLNAGPVSRSKSGVNSRQLLHQNKSVEAVDHSLQILESLMCGNEPVRLEHHHTTRGGPAIATSSLPRRPQR